MNKIMIRVRIERKGLHFVHASIQQKSCPDFLTGSIEAFQEEVKPGSLSVVASLNTHLWLLSAATLPTNLEPSSTHIVNSNFPTRFLSHLRKLEKQSRGLLILTLLQNYKLHETFWRRYQLQTSLLYIHFRHVHIQKNHRTHLPKQESWNKIPFQEVNLNQMKLEFGTMLPSYQFLLLPLERSRALPPRSHLQQSNVLIYEH